MSDASKVPVYVVSGCLGSGKTTVLSHVLQDSSMSRSAVIVNEYGKVALDHHLLRQAKEQISVVSGGCVCCTVRDDLVRELRDLLNDVDSGSSSFDRLILETTGLADPAPILYTIATDAVLKHHFTISGVIVTVDAVNGEMHLKQQPEAVKQVIAADRLLITKSDLASPDKVSHLQDQLHHLNGTASVIVTHFGNASAEDLFVPGYVLLAHNWKLSSNVALDTSTLDSKIHTMSVIFRKPLDWTAFGVWLSLLLHAHGEDVLRIKGLLDVGEEGPVAIHGVQHIVHAPEHLAAWPDDVTESFLVVITRSINPAEIVNSLSVFEHLIGVEPVSVQFQTIT